MQLNGVLQISVPPDRVVLALEDPAVLSSLFPGEAMVQRVSEGSYTFTLTKTVGFLELRQSGTIRLDRQKQGVALAVRAAHRIGGSADLKVMIGLEPGPRGAGTRIGYDGTLEASGLAGRLLRDRETQVRPFVTRVFERIRAQIESAPPVLR
jgi:carbon monoxide dehydrogenase subunit G